MMLQVLNASFLLLGVFIGFILLAVVVAYLSALGKRRTSEASTTHGAVGAYSLPMLERLREALDNGEFELYYQPIVGVDGSVYGAEALVRWNKDGNVVSPVEFMSLLESSLLLNDFTRWVVQTAVADFSKDSLQGYSVSINVPPVQLSTDDFFHLVERVIKESDFSKSRLVLEVTESGYFTLDNSVPDVIGKFKGSDYRLVLDDFGVGFSSLSRLSSYDFEGLKIDKVFTENLSDGSKELQLLEGITRICQTLNIEVTLEGVETEYHYKIAKSLGIRKFQGYYFSKPLCLKEFEEFVKEFRLG